VLYVASGTGGVAGTLYTVDPASGQVITTVGPLHDILGNLYGLTGLRYDSTLHILYGATSGQSPTDKAWLVIVNPNTALVTPIGPFLNDLSLTDIAIDPTTHIMYSISGFDQHFFTITVATGEAVIAGSTNIGFANGGGFAADMTGKLFGFSNFTFYTFDKTSLPPGNATAIGPTNARNLIKAADFSPSNVLYALEGGGGPDQTTLRWLDTCNVTTGNCTRVGQILIGATAVKDLDALAFVPQ
jgi:hypothetical protein